MTSNTHIPTSSREDEAILVLRKWMCCRAGQDQVWRELVVPFAHTLIDDEMVERAALALARETGEEEVFTDDDTPEWVRIGYRESARKALSAAFSTTRVEGDA